MRQLVYDPATSGNRMTIVCFVSGSGTNYRQIVAKNRNHRYLVFSNRPGCGGVAIARENNHEVIELSHLPFLKEVRERYGPGMLPRNCPERMRYEQEACRLIESRLGGEPDLICLTGYDQWVTDWMVDRYYPRILNVHPGDITRGYYGLHWIPSAKAIVAGDETIRSTLFFVDKGEDTGPVLLQSKPLNIAQILRASDSKGIEELSRVTDFIKTQGIKTYEDFKAQAGAELLGAMEHICKNLQDLLKIAGDWEIYPFAVHELIARGRVAVEGKTVYVDGRQLPHDGYRIDEEA